MNRYFLVGAVLLGTAMLSPSAPDVLTRLVFPTSPRPYPTEQSANRERGGTKQQCGPQGTCTVTPAKANSRLAAHRELHPRYNELKNLQDLPCIGAGPMFDDLLNWVDKQESRGSADGQHVTVERAGPPAIGPMIALAEWIRPEHLVPKATLIEISTGMPSSAILSRRS